MSEWTSVKERLPEKEGIYLLKKNGSEKIREECYGEINGKKGFFDYSGWIYPDYWKLRDGDDED